MLKGKRLNIIVCHILPQINVQAQYINLTSNFLTVFINKIKELF